MSIQGKIMEAKPLHFQLRVLDQQKLQEKNWEKKKKPPIKWATMANATPLIKEVKTVSFNNLKVILRCKVIHD